MRVILTLDEDFVRVIVEDGRLLTIDSEYGKTKIDVQGKIDMKAVVRVLADLGEDAAGAAAGQELAREVFARLLAVVDEIDALEARGIREIVAAYAAKAAKSGARVRSVTIVPPDYMAVSMARLV